MAPNHFAGLAQAQAVPTVSFALVGQAVRDLSQKRAMGVVHGNAGLGKTFAVQSALEDQAATGVEPFWFDFPEDTTPRWLTCDLLRLLTGLEHTGEHRLLRQRLLTVLAERPRLLVVDEAQRLKRRCVEHLRYLHDRLETDFALLLVGGDGCWEVISRHPMLRSRVWRRVSFSAMSPTTVLEAIPRFHPIYAGAKRELILFVDENLAHGNFRHWAGFTATAVALCQEHKLETVTEDVARAAFAKHGGGVGAA